MIILGIETSCDDTSVAIVKNGKDILSNMVANQDEYHRKFGGVVPEIAARKHLEHILSSIEFCLSEADLELDDLAGIAVTCRPGLVGSLIVGLSAAKCLSFISGKPLVGIHHLEAHIYATALTDYPYGVPQIALVASGGHTSLILLQNEKMHLLGRTVDDAAGEAYDKVAKHLGLGYPGGPIIDKLAQKGNPDIVRFPRPMLNHSNLNFSFSGLKTAVMYFLEKNPATLPEDLAAAFQDAVIDVLVRKTIQAVKQQKISNLSVVGGVAANSALRNRFSTECANKNINLYFPPRHLCTDNAAMVAGLGYHKLKNNEISDLNLGSSADAGLPLMTL